MLPMLRKLVSKVPELESALVAFSDIADAAADATASPAAVATSLMALDDAIAADVAALGSRPTPRWPKVPIFKRKRGNESITKEWARKPLVAPAVVADVAVATAEAVETRWDIAEAEDCVESIGSGMARLLGRPLREARGFRKCCVVLLLLRGRAA